MPPINHLKQFQTASMLTELRVMCEKSLRKRITLTSQWLKSTENYYVFSYLIDNELRRIQVEFDEDGAEFLKENGFIDDYKGSGKSVKMYCHKTFYVSGKNGKPVQWSRSTVVSWSDIKIYREDVIHFAAKYEYEISGSVAGLINRKPKAKIRSITQAA